MDDASLLGSFADHGDEKAFAEVVRRHSGFVYSVALRRVGGDAHMAEDVCQDVFVALGRKAAVLRRHPVLKAWLYTSVRFTAGNVMTSERRRHSRELAQTEYESGPTGAAATDWERLRPFLDKALDQLGERDRTAVILRFFEGVSFREIGRVLNIGEDGARLRVNRALEKLSGLVRRNGVSSTAATLALGLASESMAALRPGFVDTLAGSALGVLQSTAPVLGIGAGIIAFMTTKIIVGFAGAIALFSLAGGIVEWRAERASSATLAASLGQQEALRRALAESQSKIHALELRLIQSNSSGSLGIPVIGNSGKSTVRRVTAGSGGTSNYRNLPTVLGFGADIEDPKERAAGITSFNAWEMSHLTAFFQNAGVPPDVQQRLSQAFVDRQNALMDLAIAARSEGVTDDNPTDELKQESKQIYLDSNAQVAQILGPSLYQQYQTYNSTMPQRDAANQLASMLYATDSPLTGSQADQLVQTFSTNNAGRIAGASYANYGSASSVVTDAAVAQAAAYLTPTQLQALKQLQVIQQVPIYRGEVTGKPVIPSVSTGP
jgi:RNA polymerase sigma factor (sigma-70 family)